MEYFILNIISVCFCYWFLLLLFLLLLKAALLFRFSISLAQVLALQGWYFIFIFADAKFFFIELKIAGTKIIIVYHIQHLYSIGSWSMCCSLYVYELFCNNELNKNWTIVYTPSKWLFFVAQTGYCLFGSRKNKKRKKKRIINRQRNVDQVESFMSGISLVPTQFD